MVRKHAFLHRHIEQPATAPQGLPWLYAVSVSASSSRPMFDAHQTMVFFDMAMWRCSSILDAPSANWNLPYRHTSSNFINQLCRLSD
jgi:hypothetical protein